MSDLRDSMDRAGRPRSSGDPMVVLSVALGVQRRALGRTQSAVAEAAGMHQPAVAALEVGRGNPRLGAVIDLLHAVDLGLVGVTTDGVSTAIDDLPAFGASMRRARLLGGLTQSAAADRVARKQPYIARVERGIANPSLRATVEIATEAGLALAIVGLRRSDQVAAAATDPQILELAAG